MRIPRYHNVLNHSKRVITVAPMPPEKSAFALARYSRSPDSIRESIEWVRTHNSEKFLESFYFQELFRVVRTHSIDSRMESGERL